VLAVAVPSEGEVCVVFQCLRNFERPFALLLDGVKKIDRRYRRNRYHKKNEQDVFHYDPQFSNESETDEPKARTDCCSIAAEGIRAMKVQHRPKDPCISIRIAKSEALFFVRQCGGRTIAIAEKVEHRAGRPVLL